MPVTASKLREDIYKILDQAIETGVRLKSDTIAGFVFWGYNPNVYIRADRSRLFCLNPSCN